MFTRHYIVRSDDRLFDCCYFGAGGSPEIKPIEAMPEVEGMRESHFVDDAMWTVLLFRFGTGRFNVIANYRVEEKARAIA